MLQNCVIFSLFIAAIHAAGELTVLNSPKSISFKGNDALNSQFVGDVLLAAKGYAVDGNSNWDSMFINDPFNMAKNIIAVHVEGQEQGINNANGKSFQLIGSNSKSSLNAVAAELEANSESVCDLKFDEDGIQAFKTCFGDVSVTPAKATKNLNPEIHTADKEFLESIGYVYAVANNLAKMPSTTLLVKLNLVNVAKAHGEKSVAMEEAKKLVSNAINTLLAAAQKSMDSVLFVQIFEKESSNARYKRDTLSSKDAANFNLATYYNADYPIIFNIILWFMVVFGFSLLAICYAIGSMDPGRDSIIYRLSSTRMKKDN